MNLILIGAPGAGKGTAAPALCSKLALKHVSTGDIFRAEIAGKTPLGQKVQDLVKSGKLVPDTLVLEIVTNKLAEEKSGLLFDGFPRTAEQALGLDAFFQSQGKQIDAVVLLDLAEEVVVKRLSGRRTCRKCGQVYNVNSNPPKTAGVCDKCGSNDLYQREDDTEATVRKRLSVYREQTAPLIEYYKKAGKLVKIDADGAPDKVSAEILAQLGAK